MKLFSSNYSTFPDLLRWPVTSWPTLGALAVRRERARTQRRQRARMPVVKVSHGNVVAHQPFPHRTTHCSPWQLMAPANRQAVGKPTQLVPLQLLQITPLTYLTSILLTTWWQDGLVWMHSLPLRQPLQLPHLVIPSQIVKIRLISSSS